MNELHFLHCSIWLYLLLVYFVSTNDLKIEKKIQPQLSPWKLYWKKQSKWWRMSRFTILHHTRAKILNIYACFLLIYQHQQCIAIFSLEKKLDWAPKNAVHSTLFGVHLKTTEKYYKFEFGCSMIIYEKEMKPQI